MLKLSFLFLILASTLQLIANSAPNDILIHGEGNTEISSSINEYQNIFEGVPIQGTIMVTHDANNKIDPNSFRFGGKPLKVTFLQSASMSSYGGLEVSTYSFELEGMKKGTYTLPPISVTIGGKVYVAQQMTLEVAGNPQ